MGKTKTPLEWAYEHTANLKTAKERLIASSVNSEIDTYLQSLSDTEYRPGYWTILKNITLAYCINPFGVILNRYNIRDTVYLDLFCGSGITPLKDIVTNENKWIVGSPIIATRMTDYPYQNYFFGDINKKSLELLNQILECQNKNSDKKIDYNILPADDANNNLDLILDKLKNKYVFAYIDPTGFQWNWESMEKLVKLNMFDILMNFQTREVDRLTSSDKIELFFGQTSDKINTCKTCDEKLDLYIKQLNDKGLYVNSIKIGKDKTNQYYYHLLHISRKNTYAKIIQDLQRRIEVFTGKTIRLIWNDLSKDVRQTSIIKF